MPTTYSRPLLLSIRGTYSMLPNKLIFHLDSEALYGEKAIAALWILEKGDGLLLPWNRFLSYKTRVQSKYMSSQVLQTELCPAHTGWETSISSVWLWCLSVWMKHQLKLLVLTKNKRWAVSARWELAHRFSSERQRWGIWGEWPGYPFWQWQIAGNPQMCYMGTPQWLHVFS